MTRRGRPRIGKSYDLVLTDAHINAIRDCCANTRLASAGVGAQLRAVLDVVDWPQVSTALRPRLVIMRGLPGSGKTTLANEWIGGHTNWAISSRDLIRPELGISDGVGTDADEMAVTAVQESQIRRWLTRGTSVVVDDTNLDLTVVTWLANIADDCGAVVDIDDRPLSTPVDVCIERDAQRTRPVGAAVIRQMAS